MSEPGLDGTDPGRLAELLEISEGEAANFGPDELAAIWQHQLASSIRIDLGEAAGEVVRALHDAAAQGPLDSFGDLLGHPKPPVQLLRLAKDFAKARRRRREAGLPPEIATMLYYAGIAAALVRCRERISELDDATQRGGFQWALDQPWADPETRSLFEEGLKELDQGRQPGTGS